MERGGLKVYFFHQILVNFEGRIFLGIVTFGIGCFGANATTAFSRIRIHTTTVTFKLAIFFKNHFDSEPSHEEGNGAKGEEKGNNDRVHSNCVLSTKKAAISCGSCFAPQAGLEPATP